MGGAPAQDRAVVAGAPRALLLDLDRSLLGTRHVGKVGDHRLQPGFVGFEPAPGGAEQERRLVGGRPDHHRNPDAAVGNLARIRRQRRRVLNRHRAAPRPPELRGREQSLVEATIIRAGNSRSDSTSNGPSRTCALSASAHASPRSRGTVTSPTAATGRSPRNARRRAASTAGEGRCPRRTRPRPDRVRSPPNAAAFARTQANARHVLSPQFAPSDQSLSQPSEPSRYLIVTTTASAAAATVAPSNTGEPDSPTAQPPPCSHTSTGLPDPPGPDVQRRAVLVGHASRAVGPRPIGRSGCGGAGPNSASARRPRIDGRRRSPARLPTGGAAYGMPR